MVIWQSRRQHNMSKANHAVRQEAGTEEHIEKKPEDMKAKVNTEVPVICKLEVMVLGEPYSGRMVAQLTGRWPNEMANADFLLDEMHMLSRQQRRKDVQAYIEEQVKKQKEEVEKVKAEADSKATIEADIKPDIDKPSEA